MTIEEKMRNRGATAERPMDAYIRVNPSDARDRVLAASFGINITQWNIDNLIMVDPDFQTPRSQLNVSFHGSENIILLEKECAIYGNFDFVGSNNIAVVCGSQSTLNLSATIYDGGILKWGRGSSAYGARVWIHGSKACTVGSGCLFSEQIQMRTSDHHAMIDLNSLSVISTASDVVIGDRVWLGEGVSILKGVSIGSGAIIGARSLVTRSVGSGELWAGVPARPLRRNVTWTDSWNPTSAEISDAVRVVRRRPYFRPSSLIERVFARRPPRGNHDPS